MASVSSFLSLAFYSSSDFRRFHTAILLTPGVKGGVVNGVLTAEFTGRTPGFSLAENTDDLFVGKRFFMVGPHVTYEDITNIAVC
ncbi:hypothetical protein QE407_001239 [Pantoea dispersa]|nr:hypothetical protein [Pantoea dispersa]